MNPQEVAQPFFTHPVVEMNGNTELWKSDPTQSDIPDQTSPTDFLKNIRMLSESMQKRMDRHLQIEEEERKLQQETVKFKEKQAEVRKSILRSPQKIRTPRFQESALVVAAKSPAKVKRNLNLVKKIFVEVTIKTQNDLALRIQKRLEELQIQQETMTKMHEKNSSSKEYSNVNWRASSANTSGDSIINAVHHAAERQDNTSSSTDPFTHVSFLSSISKSSDLPPLAPTKRDKNMYSSTHHLPV